MGAALGSADHHEIELDRYEIEFDEQFEGPELITDRWIPHYLPHWSTPDRTLARYDLRPGLLRLRIDVDQPAWRIEDGPMRVSNIQTGVFAGPLGSSIGQHRHRPDLEVRTEQPSLRLYTPVHGYIEAKMRASDDPRTMLAFWLVGHEGTSAEDSGEICIVEIPGDGVSSHGSTLRMGIKAHNDSRIADDMVELSPGIDARAWHTYGAEWTPDGVRFFVDREIVYESPQRLAYPLQLMVDLFEFPDDENRDPLAYPKLGDIGSVRGYRPRSRG